MKIYNKIILALILGFIPFSACDTDELTDMNVNPNASSEIDWRFNMALAQLESCENRYVNWRANIIYSANLIQHLGGTGYSAGYTQTDFPSHSAAYFDTYYERSLKEAGEVLRNTGPDGVNPEMTNTYNVTRIVYIIAIHRMVDLYGNVPYFEASRGIEGIFNPHYDDVQAIYTQEGIDDGGVRGGMLWELNQAATALATPGTDDLSTNDMIYNGDLTKWRKVAYSLMLRLAMRIQEVDKATSDKYIGIAVGSGLLIDNADDNAWCPMATGPDVWLNQNGYSRAMQPSDGGHNNVLGKPLVDFLKGVDPADAADDDPRLLMISGGIGTWEEMEAETSDLDPLNQEGIPNGLDQERLNDYLGLPPDTPTDYMTIFSKTNPKLLDWDEPYVIMTAGEVELLLAECALRGIAGVTDAQTHFENGVREDIRRYELHDAGWVVDGATIDAYIATLGAVDVEKVGDQYYIATFMNHYEAWANWRRTGYPTIVDKQDPPLPSSLTNGEIFRRLKYPTSEPAVNPNYAEGAMAPNDFMNRLWWDVGN